MASYEAVFAQNSGLQVGHSSGNIYYNSSAPNRNVDSAFDIPDLLSPYFTGRKQELLQLKELYSASRTSGPGRCIVYGMPGLGKTQLALRFANLNKENYPFIFWISGASTEKLGSGFTRILDYVGGEGRDADARIQATKRWFETQENKWLLIVDNVNEETMPHLRDVLPARNEKGNVLITTRYQGVAESLKFALGECHNIVELQLLQQEDAVDMFFATRDKGTGNENNSGDLKSATLLVKKVGCLPLAVDQAASLSKAPGQTIHKVLDIYNSSELHEALSWDSETTKHENVSVSACFSLVIDQLLESSPEACDLLRIFAFLDPESISLEVVEHGIINYECRRDITPEDLDPPSSGIRGPSQRLKKKNMKKKQTDKRKRHTESTIDHDIEPGNQEAMQRLRVNFESPIKLQKLIRVLQRSSIVKVKDEVNSVFWIHDLVHQQIRENFMNKNQRQRWLDTAIDVVSNSFGLIENPHEVEQWGKTERFVAHIQKLREEIGEVKTINMLDTIESWIAEYFLSRGRYKEASKILERLVASDAMLRDKEGAKTLHNLYALANVYNFSGRAQEAEKILSEMVKVTKRVFGSDSDNTMASMAGLAISYELLGRHREAEKLNAGVLAIRKRLLGPEHPDTLMSASNLALSYTRLGRLQEAEKLNVEVLAVRKRVLGSEHPDTLMSMNNLASLYSRLGRLQEAEKLHVEVLAISKRVLGLEHPDTLVSMDNLAFCFHDNRKINAAIDLMRTTVELRSKILGTEHPQTRDSVETLSDWTNSAGDPQG